jgi:hypothetical protein
MIFSRNRMQECGEDSAGSGEGPVIGSCQHGTFWFHKGGKFLDQPSNYSKSCDIRYQRVAGYCNFPDIRMLYLMCILVYLATSWTDLTI